MGRERRHALGIFLSVIALACNYSPLIRDAFLPFTARADVAASAKAEEGRTLIPGGQAVGIALKTQGVLVVAKSDQSESKTLLRIGDVIETVQGVPVTSAAELSKKIGACQTDRVKLGVWRDGKKIVLDAALPVSVDGQRRLNVWVRDSTAGVGTLSYIDPDSGAYGALGHAIVDGDTGDMLPVADGAIMKASVIGVIKGQSGRAGELKGSFLKENEQIGTLRLNSVYGIYGTMDVQIDELLYPQGLPVGTRELVHTGAASIISTVDGDGPKEYSVEILRCFSQSKPSQKGMALFVNKKSKSTPETSKAALEFVKPILEGIDEWTEVKLHDVIMEAIPQTGMKNATVLWPLRIAVTGRAATPGGAFEMLYLLGKDEALKRLNDAMAKL